MPLCTALANLCHATLLSKQDIIAAADGIESWYNDRYHIDCLS